MRCWLLSMILAVGFAMGPSLPAKESTSTPRKKSEKSRQLTEADNKKTVKLSAGASFDIALKGNATTGYQWQVVQIDGDAVQQTEKVDYIQEKHPEGVLGIGGTFVFHFKFAKAAKTKIRMVYARPWEKDKTPEKIFEVTIAPSS
jgi:inhibitor of cysteine peptidase